MDAERLLDALRQAEAQSAFWRYRPYGHPDTLCPDGVLWKERGYDMWSNKPWQMEFHNCGMKERALIAANGVGKSMAPTWEVAAHAMGEYPDWYTGLRYDRPVKIWVGAIDADQQREGVQTHLLGKDMGPNLGTGFIPRDRIVGNPSTRQAGLKDVCDRVSVQYKGGKGASLISFKTYAQGGRSWQAAAPDIILLDEEPSEFDAKEADVFQEAQTRLVRSSGLLMTGLTPLLGETALTRHFMYPTAPGIYCGFATWDDAPHLKEADKARLRATYPQHQADTRTLGVPMMGEGRVFDVSEDDISCFPFEIPHHYARIAGIDFGIDEKHPTACAWLAWDRDRDVLYLTDEYRRGGQVALIHAESIKSRGPWIPVAWPHDGENRDKGSGKQLKEHYIDHGVNMLSVSARYDRKVGGAQPVEPIVQTLYERMKTGRFYVFNTCRMWLEEFRSFHRKKGQIVAMRDDLMKATFYGTMMLPYAYSNPGTTHVPGQNFMPTLRMHR